MATLHDRIAWTVYKDGRVTQAALRAHPDGTEFRLLNTGTVLWAELWRHGYDPAALDAAVACVRRVWLAKGWQPVEPADSAASA